MRKLLGVVAVVALLFGCGSSEDEQRQQEALQRCLVLIGTIGVLEPSEKYMDDEDLYNLNQLRREYDIFC
jgi:hypothetical protein